MFGYVPRFVSSSFRPGARRPVLTFRRSGFLLRSRLCLHSIRTIKAGTVSGHVVSHRLVDVGVMDNVGIHARHRRVVLEVVSLPSSAPVAVAVVAVAVVNAPVKTDSWSPVTLVKRVYTVVPAPPGRCPKYTH